MKTNPISFNFDITAEIEEYIESTATKLGEYPLGVLVGAIGKILSESDESFNDTNITLKTVAPVEGNPCPYPALVVAGNEIEIIIAPSWNDPVPRVKYPVGSVVLYPEGCVCYSGEICEVVSFDIKEGKVNLHMKILTGDCIGEDVIINQNEIKKGVE